MYAVDALSQISHSDAKSSLQALLKNRDQTPVITNQGLPGDTQGLCNFLNPNPNYINQVISSENSPNYSSSSSQINSGNELSSSSEVLDHQKDFNYSQKLFHIADGNLYSIFSPIQGRSYGMKPSFLRKQKYTVQECRSRGHKNLRKGLKFHNFLPSESVTSEKDSGYLRKWKVHSECRLREEHGTKQITISNWSQSIQNLANDQSSISSQGTVLNEPYSAECLSTLKTQNNDSGINSSVSSNLHNASTDYIKNKIKSNDIFNTEVCSFSKASSSLTCDNIVSNDLHDVSTIVKAHSDCPLPRKNILNNVLTSLRDSSAICKSTSCDKTENNSIRDLNSQQHRRKPVHTRRIVPYTKYLSLIEENETAPLDLSSKYGTENLKNPYDRSETASTKKFEIIQNNSEDSVKSFNSQTTSQKTKKLQSLDHLPNMPHDSINMNDASLQNNISPPLTLLYPLPANQSISHYQGSWPQLQSKDNLNMQFNANGPMNSLCSSSEENVSAQMTSQLGNTHYEFQKPFMKESRPKTRRRSQRSVIKQKLEDTFKQNGFLVKTKQVSDGEATFCKFRQLRKYTRYYLKSWQQHLPDEVSKMWKGFLPPKTVIPPAPNVAENT